MQLCYIGFIGKYYLLVHLKIEFFFSFLEVETSNRRVDHEIDDQRLGKENWKFNIESKKNKERKKMKKSSRSPL